VKLRGEMSETSPEFDGGQLAAYLRVITLLERMRVQKDLFSNTEVAMLVALHRVADLAAEVGK
jgi:hypothetical protein